MAGQFAIGEGALGRHIGFLETPTPLSTATTYNELYGLAGHTGKIAAAGGAGWAFDEKTGTTISAETGSITGASLRDTSLIGNSNGPAWRSDYFSMDGTNDGINFGYQSDLNNSTEQSIWGWVYLDTTADGQTVLGNWKNYNDARHQIWTSGGYFQAYAGGSPAKDATGTAAGAFNTGQWYFVGSRLTASEISLFVDDSGAMTNNVASTLVAGTADLTSGYSDPSVGNYRLNGRIAGHGAAPIALVDSEFTELYEGPEPDYIGAGVTVSQTSTYMSASGVSYDNQGNGTIAYTYQWEVADDASGTNSENRSRTATCYPKAGDNGKYARFTVTATNDGGNDPSQDQTSAWTLITADVPATEGQTAAVHGVVPASGSTSFTKTGFGTVAGAIIIASQSDGTTQELADAHIGVGFWDSTNDQLRACTMLTPDNSSSSAASKRSTSSGSMVMIGQLRFTVSAVTDGVQLTYSGGPATDDFHATVILFDENCIVESGYTQASSSVFPSFEFEFAPEGVLFVSSGQEFVESASNGLISLGAVDKYGRQVLNGFGNDDNASSAVENKQMFSADSVFGQVFPTGDWYTSVSWASQGYVLETDTTGSALTDVALWIAVANVGVSVESNDGPTANGTVTYPAKGVSDPQCTMFLNTVMQPGTGSSIGGEAQFWGIGIDDGVDPRSHGMCIADNISPSLAKSCYGNGESQTSWVPISATTIVQSKSASVDSFGNGAQTLDYTIGTGTARVFGTITFGSLTPADPGYNWMFGKGKWADSGTEPTLNTHWEMQDNAASTQVTDSSGNGNHGTLLGGRTTADLSVAGDAWSPLALQGDGIADYIDFAAATTAAFDDQHTAVLRWKNPAAVANAYHWGRSDNNQSSFWIDSNGDRMRYRQGATNVTFFTRTMPLNQWDGVAINCEEGQPIRSTYDGASQDGGTMPSGTYQPPYFMRRNTAFSSVAYREFILLDRTTTDSERLQMLAGPEPTSDGAPVLGGTFEEGQTVSVSDPNFDLRNNGTGVYTYQWYEATDAVGTGATVISGATSSSYTLPAGSLGKFIGCFVTATNDGGNDPVEDTFSAFTEVASGGGGPTTVIPVIVNHYKNRGRM